MTETPQFNLINERWIPVVHRDGQFERLGLQAVLEQAAEIREVRGASPLDTFAIYRFLLAVLLWCKPGLRVSERAQMRQTGGFPEEWFAKVEQSRDCFYLLHAEHPFYQDPTVSGKRVSANYLIHELPSGSKIAHFRHMRDLEDGLCLRCCAMGLLRWSIYASAGTAGGGESMTATIHGNTPTYMLKVGSTLDETLLLNWPIKCDVEGDRPVWGGAAEGTPLGPLKALTWRSRCILLAPPDTDGMRDLRPGVCCWCGERVRELVRTIFFRPGWKRPSKNDLWQDTHVMRIAVPSKKTQGVTKPREALPSWPSPNDPLQDQSGIWLTVVRGLLQRPDYSGENDTRVQTTLMANQQALYKHAAERRDELPGRALHQRTRLLEELDWLERTIGMSVDPRAAKQSWSTPPKGHIVVRTARGDNAKGHAIRAGLSAWSPTIQCELAGAFRQLMLELPAATDETLAAVTRERIEQWRQKVIGIIEQASRRSATPALVGGLLTRAETLRAVTAAIRHAAKDKKTSASAESRGPSATDGTEQIGGTGGKRRRSKTKEGTR